MGTSALRWVCERASRLHVLWCSVYDAEDDDDPSPSSSDTLALVELSLRWMTTDGAVARAWTPFLVQRARDTLRELTVETTSAASPVDLVESAIGPGGSPRLQLLDVTLRAEAFPHNGVDRYTAAIRTATERAPHLNTLRIGPRSDEQRSAEFRRQMVSRGIIDESLVLQVGC